MKVLANLQSHYRSLPDDFEQRFDSVVTTPYHGIGRATLYRKLRAYRINLAGDRLFAPVERTREGKSS